MRAATNEEKRAHLLSIAGWREDYVDGRGMRWTFFPKDKRRRASDDYSLDMAYDIAISGRRK